MNNELVQKYGEELQRFVSEYDLPDAWFVEPDHIAFKASDSSSFGELIKNFEPISSRISAMRMDGRRLATAELSTSVQVLGFGAVRLVELMEPRPEKVGTDYVGLEHMEFYYPNFEEVKTQLDTRKIAYTEQSNSGHAWINVVLNTAGQELKLNNKLLADTVADEISRGETEVIWQSK